MVAKYAPKHGTPYSQNDANVVCPELVRLLKTHGGSLTPNEVVEAARGRRSPLHRYIFRDSDAVAAEKYRVVLAGKLLRSFEVILKDKHGQRRLNVVEYVVQLTDAESTTEEDSEEATPRVRPKGRVRPARNSRRKAYVSILDVMSTPEYQEQLVQRAKDDLQSWKNRYERVKGLVDFRTKFGRAFQQICELFADDEDRDAA